MNTFRADRASRPVVEEPVARTDFGGGSKNRRQLTVFLVGSGVSWAVTSPKPVNYTP
jgi:hypothetical protein